MTGVVVVKSVKVRLVVLSVSGPNVGDGEGLSDGEGLGDGDGLGNGEGLGDGDGLGDGEGLGSVTVIAIVALPP